MVVRPLHCSHPGVWKSHDFRFTFMRHESDPQPKRWFAYDVGSDYPLYDAGHISLAEAVRDVEILTEKDFEE